MANELGAFAEYRRQATVDASAARIARRRCASAKPADESAECAGQRREVARTALVEHCVAAAVVEGILNFFLNKVDSLIPFDFFVLVDAFALFADKFKGLG